MLCTNAGVLSALLGAAGSILLAVPWANDLALRLRTDRRVRRAVRDHGPDAALTKTLSDLQARQLNQPPDSWVAITGLLGAFMLALSFAIVLGGTLRHCPA